MAYRGPISYKDPLYAQLARQMEAEQGLPTGILDAIRTQGERSNANQVSSAGAQTPYQVIPSTRRGMIRNYGVDPWAGAEEATKAAALHLKESYGRTQSWDKAVAGYHGGIKAERGIRGPANRAYTGRTGSFDGAPKMAYNPDMTQPYYPEDAPLAPEMPKTTVPVPGAGPSVPVGAASPVASKKRGGLLGAIQSVIMPSPDTLWGQALNGEGGLWNAQVNLDAYKTQKARSEAETQMTQAKLKNLMTKGEYQIAGNNVIHFPADGGAPKVITPPRTLGEKESLIEKWRTMDANDPAKELIQRMLLGANSDAALQNRTEVARTRAAATTTSAGIRAKNSGSNAPKYEYREVNGKLQRRRIN